MQTFVQMSKTVHLRRFGKRLLTLVTTAFLLSTLVCGAIGWKLLHPARTPIKYVPETFGLPYENVQFHSNHDGVPLKGWLIPDNNNDRESIVIFAHGYLDNRSDNTAPLTIASMLRKCDISSLLFDFRNSGESGGAITSFGFHEKDDLLGAVSYAKALGYKKIGLLGFSMGASTALITAAEDNDVKVVVADSPYADFRQLLEDAFSRMSKLPKFPFAPMLYYETAYLGGLQDSAMSPINVIRRLADRPVLLIHAINDYLVPSDNSKKLYALSDKATTDLWMTKSSLHVGSYYLSSNVYVAKVSDFFVDSFDKVKLTG